MENWFLKNNITMTWGYAQTKFDTFAKEDYILEDLAYIYGVD